MPAQLKFGIARLCGDFIIHSAKKIARYLHVHYFLNIEKALDNADD